MDDDNYVNPEALLSLLSTFPQDGDIYVGKPSLDKPITAHELLEGNATVLLLRVYSKKHSCVGTPGPLFEIKGEKMTKRYLPLLLRLYHFVWPPNLKRLWFDFIRCMLSSYGFTLFRIKGI